MRSIPEAARALLEADDEYGLKRVWRPTGLLREDVIQIGPVPNSLRRCDIIVDIKGTVWSSALDRTSQHQCSLGISMHELVLTHSSLSVRGRADLCEFWLLSRHLADLGAWLWLNPRPQ